MFDQSLKNPKKNGPKLFLFLRNSFSNNACIDTSKKLAGGEGASFLLGITLTSLPWAMTADIFYQTV